jgi:hypothetical protein
VFYADEGTVRDGERAELIADARREISALPHDVGDRGAVESALGEQLEGRLDDRLAGPLLLAFSEVPPSIGAARWRSPP